MGAPCYSKRHKRIFMCRFREKIPRKVDAIAHARDRIITVNQPVPTAPHHWSGRIVQIGTFNIADDLKTRRLSIRLPTLMLMPIRARFTLGRIFVCTHGVHTRSLFDRTRRRKMLAWLAVLIQAPTNIPSASIVIQNATTSGWNRLTFVYRHIFKITNNHHIIHRLTLEKIRIWYLYEYIRTQIEL